MKRPPFFSLPVRRRGRPSAIVLKPEHAARLRELAKAARESLEIGRWITESIKQDILRQLEREFPGDFDEFAFTDSRQPSKNGFRWGLTRAASAAFDKALAE